MTTTLLDRAESILPQIVGELRKENDAADWRKAELLALEQERDEELADLRYGEDTYGSPYPVPTRYELSRTCEGGNCVRDTRVGRWDDVCKKHEGLR